MFYLQIFAALFLTMQDQRFETSGVTIINTSPGGASTTYRNHNAGPSTGDMLKFHYFPGLEDYGAGRYTAAAFQMSYVIDRPQYLEGNPRRSEFLSTSYYVRGMIYLYHAIGAGRHRLAKEDFEVAIKFNPQNYVAYLELSRLYSQLGFKDPAVSSLRVLLDLKPDKATADEARAELKRLGADTGDNP